ncbi:hypothetical protein VPNG_05626 [Cytospora leucostoma]|uniref:Uncharacterized protein n=1 Tax=Cytospora leucostoma TaxID=1230097 RepID=A0A423X6Y7_9PEZI|nr:hypothetical protein VPNG_05626 [Cytospora leucostoma]
MGGKRWTAEEESIFWRDIARSAPTSSTVKGKKGEKARARTSWRPLVKRMKRRMKEVHPNMVARREYTTFSCYEHYFQNYIQGKCSPNAGPYVAEYKAWLQRKQAGPAPRLSSEALATIKHNTRAAQRQKVARRLVALAPAAPHVGNATQMAPAAPMQPVSFNSSTVLTTAPVTPDLDEISVTSSQGLSSESASPQEVHYGQFMPANEGHSYPSSTGSSEEASMSHTQRMTAHTTTQGNGDFVFNGSMQNQPSASYNGLGYGGFMPAPHAHGRGNSNDLPTHFFDYLAAQFRLGNGGVGQAYGPYAYNRAGVYSSCNAHEPRLGSEPDLDFIDPALERITKQFSSSV